MRHFTPSLVYAAQFPTQYEAQLDSDGSYKSFSISEKSDKEALGNLIKAGLEKYGAARWNGEVRNRTNGHGFSVAFNHGRQIAEIEF